MTSPEASTSRSGLRSHAPTAAAGRAGSGVPKAKNVVMASHGRAPWYGPDGKGVEAYVIGIAGGSASGKVGSIRSDLSDRLRHGRKGAGTDGVAGAHTSRLPWPGQFWRR